MNEFTRSEEGIEFEKMMDQRFKDYKIPFRWADVDCVNYNTEGFLFSVGVPWLEEDYELPPGFDVVGLVDPDSAFSTTPISYDGKTLIEEEDAGVIANRTIRNAIHFVSVTVQKITDQAANGQISFSAARDLITVMQANGFIDVHPRFFDGVLKLIDQIESDV